MCIPRRQVTRDFGREVFLKRKWWRGSGWWTGKKDWLGGVLTFTAGLGKSQADGQTGQRITLPLWSATGWEEPGKVWSMGDGFRCVATGEGQLAAGESNRGPLEGRPEGYLYDSINTLGLLAFMHPEALDWEASLWPAKPVIVNPWNFLSFMW